MVESILAHGFRLDATGGSAQEMLEQAASTGVESLVTALISRGVKVDPGSRGGTTLLHGVIGFEGARALIRGYVEWRGTRYPVAALRAASRYRFPWES